VLGHRWVWRLAGGGSVRAEPERLVWPYLQCTRCDSVWMVGGQLVGPAMMADKAGSLTPSFDRCAEDQGQVTWVNPTRPTLTMSVLRHSRRCLNARQ
jgi:hypothetical protein